MHLFLVEKNSFDLNGKKNGTCEVWACHLSDAQEPPRRGWKVRGVLSRFYGSIFRFHFKHFFASKLEAIAIRLEAIATRVEAIAR